jgi:hypothetical protein
MSNYHISINGETSMVTEMPDLATVDLCAEWDMTSPFVIVHKGDYSARTLQFAGWPEVTNADYARDLCVDSKE